MLETPVRNHPTVMVQNISVMVIVFVSIFFAYASNGVSVLILGILVAFAMIAVILIMAWYGTTVYATDMELVHRFDFIVHKRKTVPYAKIASVNVVRNIFNRIFGTATIQVNINSSINAARPEISLCLKNDMANKVRDELSARIYGLNYTSEAEHVYESSIELTNRDAILHGLFGSSSWFVISSVAFTLMWLIFDLVLTKGEAMAVTTTFLLFAVSFLLPAVALVLRYYNFRVYRLGDTIYLQHGAIQLYKTSFKVNKINSVRIKRTFFARLMGKACLEVDVVGINATEDTTPVLCILTTMENIENLMREVVPDFIYEKEGERQPRGAAVPWLMRAFWGTCATAVLYAYPTWCVFFGELPWISTTFVSMELLRIGLIGSFVGLSLLYFWAAHIGFNKNRLDVGEDMFMFDTGIVDRVRTVMQYDRAQIVDVYAWPSARRHGLARCSVSMLSSSGHSKAVSGYYPVEQLDAISEEVMERIKDGRYDYRKSVF